MRFQRWYSDKPKYKRRYIRTYDMRDNETAQIDQNSKIKRSSIRQLLNVVPWYYGF